MVFAPSSAFLKSLDRLGADVEADKPRIRELDRNGLSRVERIVRVNDLMVRRQQQFDAGVLSLLLDLQCLWHHVVLDERLADGKALRLEERVGHRAADQGAYRPFARSTTR